MISNNPKCGKLSVIFLSAESEFKGGAERSLSILVEELGEYQDLDLFIFTPGQGEVSAFMDRLGVDRVEMSGVDLNKIRRSNSVRENLKNMWPFLQTAFGLAKKIRALNIQIIHSNSLKTHLLSSLIRLFNWKVKVIWHIRDILENKFHRMVLSLFSMFADRIILVSKACEANFLWSQGKQSVIRNPVNTKVATDENSAQYDPHRKDLRIGIFGRISPYKGQSEAVDVLYILRQKGIDARLYIYGTCWENQTYENELKRKIHRMELGGSVIFQGHVSNVSTAYRYVDVVLVPSPKPDPLPRVVYEGFFHRKPVFAYDVGGIREIYQVNADRYLSSVDARKTANQIYSYVNNASAYEEDIERHFEYVITCLTPENHGRQVIEVYCRALKWPDCFFPIRSSNSKSKARIKSEGSIC